jgi:hypothetical protein
MPAPLAFRVMLRFAQAGRGFSFKRLACTALTNAQSLDGDNNRSGGAGQARTTFICTDLTNKTCASRTSLVTQGFYYFAAISVNILSVRDTLNTRWVPSEVILPSKRYPSKPIASGIVTMRRQHPGTFKLLFHLQEPSAPEEGIE